MEAQGYQVKDNILFQDNKSTMLLEKNGKALSSKCMKHINVRYFFITNHINNNDLSIMWCPTSDMIRDFMTKPLQGALFLKFRDQIMGVVLALDPGPRKVNKGMKQKKSKNASRSGLSLRDKLQGDDAQPAPKIFLQTSLAWFHMAEPSNVTTGVCWRTSKSI